MILTGHHTYEQTLPPATSYFHLKDPKGSFRRRKYYPLAVIVAVFLAWMCYTYNTTTKDSQKLSVNGLLNVLDTSRESSSYKASSTATYQAQHTTQSTDIESPIKIVLMTFFRGGSTFLGEAFNRNREAFYWFEPLVPYMEEYRRILTFTTFNNEATFLQLDNGSQVYFPDDYIDHQTDVLVNILNCDLHLLSPSILNHYFLTDWAMSQSLLPYRECLLEQTKKTETEHAAINTCRHLAEQGCKSSRIRVIKTIRLSMYMVPKLLEKDPEIKLVYYVRDPRASFISACNIWKIECSLELSKLWADQFCHRLQDDYSWIAGAYTQSVLVLYYEEMAQSYNKILQELYSYLSLMVPDTLLNWFEENTHGINDSTALGTMRKNSSDTAGRWKRQLPHEVKQTMTEICREALIKFHYDTD